MRATMRDLTRYLARRFAWHMLGAAIGAALVLLVYSLLSVAVPGLPAGVVAVATVAAGFGLGLVPGARELEVTAARALLEVEGDLVVPAAPRPAHRVRTALWVAGHLVSGLVVVVSLFAVIPTVVLVAVEALRGDALDTGYFSGVIPPPGGPVELTVRLVLCGVVGLLALVATWPLGAAASRLAGRVLGPTPYDRMETALARANREAEHTRLARELHDGIGHALTVVSVQAAAGRRVVRANPDAAADALGAIEDTARSALTELDQLLAVLRDDTDGTGGAGGSDGAGDAAPVAVGPALGDVVSAHRRAGLDLEAHLDLPTGLPPLLSRTVQRIVTEGLTNAHRHGGPGPVRLTVDHDADGLRIEVLNPVRPGSWPSGGRTGRRTGGRGLVGVSERVALFGGTVDSGPEAAGPSARWALRARLPCAPLTGAPQPRSAAHTDGPTNEEDSHA